jgi:signal transduction histidine kinase/sugar lactone lactonase YvrE
MVRTGRVIEHLTLPAPSTELALIEDRAGLLWIVHGPRGALSSYDRVAKRLTTWHPSANRARAETDDVRFSTLLEDRDGQLWAGTSTHGILRLDRDARRFVRYTNDPARPHSLADRRVTVLAQDREGVIWVGLHQAAPNYFLGRPSPFATIDAQNGASTLVSALLHDAAGGLWVGLDRGVRHRAPGALEFREVPALSGIETTSAAVAPGGDLWFGTAGFGLLRYEPTSGRLTRFQHRPNDGGALPSDFVEQVRTDRTGTVWAVTWRGLASWQPSTNRFRTIAPVNVPADLTFHTAAFTRNGTIWLGSNRGVHRFDPRTGTFAWYRHNQHLPASLSNDRVNSILEAADGTLWIGTQSALEHWESTGTPIRRFSQADGLPGAVVSCILEDSARHVWVSTELGIARLDARTAAIRTYGEADGLPGVNFTGWDTCLSMSAGTMYFAGFAGAVIFDPRSVRDRDFAPPVAITGVRILGRRADSLQESQPEAHQGSLTLRPHQDKLTFEFANLSFLSPSTNRLRFRLIGLHDQWTEVAGDQRVATYVGLRPGRFRFEVQGATGRGAWNPSAATMDILIEPPWWQTTTFYLLATVAGLAVVVVSYRLRVRQLTFAYRVRLDERFAERHRIARELHDTLLQSFQGLMFHLQAVRDLLPKDPARAMPLLELTLQRGEAAIDEARGAVGALRGTTLADQDLAAGLAALATAAALHTDAARRPIVHHASTGTPRSIPPSVFHELYRAAREALSNAMKHAQASRNDIEVRFDPEQLRILILDDGIGFDAAAKNSDRHQRHFGLKGLHERLVVLGGRARVQRQSPRGTAVELVVPAAVAYQSPDHSATM